MKKNLLMIASMATAIMALSSCSNSSEETVSNEPQVIRLEVIGTNNGAQTRAAFGTDGAALQNTQFISGENINVEAYPTGGVTTYTTGTFTTTSTGGSTTGSILLSGTLYYHPTSNIDICAYYPATVVTTPSPLTTFTVNADQTETNIANYRSSDLMYATKLTNKGKLDAPHGLTFNHALSQIIVNISPGSGLVASDITSNVSSVKINNTITVADLAFGVSAGVPTGVVTATASSAAASDIEIKGDGASNIGIIIPQDVASGTTFISITYNGNPYTWALPANKTFAAGTKYTYNFTLNLGGLVLESTIITDWADGGSETPIINL